VFGFGGSRITTAELATRLAEGTPVLVDVREPYEFAEGHVPGAVNIPLASLGGRLKELDPTAETIVICRSGHRSATAAKLLKRAGFTDVHNVRGGTMAWRGPLER
jgi:rhodanese-related sulfurtransferase